MFGGPGGQGGAGGFSIIGNVVTLEAIGGGQPSQMLYPSGTSFPGVNQGVKNFDPYVIGPATFSLALAGVTADTTVTAAMFSFGTSPDTFLPGTRGGGENPLPEPSSIALLTVGLGGLLGLRRVRKSH